jgi:hypothetical protein|tara:strand:- start:113 stop:823 length:711 start_codon:yes stop_codon:yes gene_type:complete
MPTEILNTRTSEVLRSFADKLWESLLRKDSDIKSIQPIYYKSVDDLLIINSQKTSPKKEKAKKNKKKKPSIPIPFYGHIETNWCRGVKKNHGLYTQCVKAKPEDCDYCVVCMRQAQNNADGKPNCGNINERASVWNENLDYKPPGMKQEIPYANIVKKLNISISDAQEEVEKMGWSPIPECHLIEKKVRRGRPKTKIVVEDSDDDEPKKKRGRPKKEKKNEPTDDELIAMFLEQSE